MTKVAIKNENITPFGGIYHIMYVFKLYLKELTEPVLGQRGSSGRDSAMAVSLSLSSSATFVRGMP